MVNMFTDSGVNSEVGGAMFPESARTRQVCVCVCVCL